MLTIFAIPKAFKGHINIIQRNAIQSWLRLCPEAEIILFGDDQGVAETAKELGLLHIPKIKKNEFGTPLLDSVFNSARKATKNPFLAIISTDIILMDNFVPVIQQIKKPLFLMGGRRWDFDIKEPIQFSKSDWREKLYDRAVKNNKRRGFTSIDYFVFPRDLPHNLPSFAVGRPGWDNWLIYHIRSLKIPVIDTTEAINIIHQNHDYSHSLWGKGGKFGGRVEGPEFKKNFRLAGGSLNMLTLRDADWILTPQGLKRPEFQRFIFSKFSLFYPWRVMLFILRKTMLLPILRKIKRKIKQLFL